MRRKGWINGMVAALASAALVVQPVLAQTADLQDPARAGQIAVQMQRSLTAIEDGLTLMDKTRWDPQAVVDAQGTEPEALRTWLRSHVAWVPYAGALRGASGVLADRRGNTLDGALLMAALLSDSGYQVRIDQAKLSDVAVQSLLTQPASPAPDQIAAQPAEDALGPTEATYDLTSGGAAQALAAPLTRAQFDLVRIAQSVIDPGAAIRKALPARDLDAEAKATDAQVKTALSQHFWVEYLNGTTWAPADWMTADGQPPAAATATFAPDALPDDLVQRVTFRLLEEQVKDGKAEVSSMDEVSVVPARGEGRQVSLTHQPMAWPADWPTVTAQDVQDKLRSAFITQTEWWPILSVDGVVHQGPSMRADGSQDDVPQPKTDPFTGIGVKLGGQVLQAADALDQGDGASTDLAQGVQDQTGEWTGEWLSFTIEAPGEPPRTEVRPIFDLIGPAARAAGQAGAFKISDETRGLRAMRAMSEVEIGILPATLSSDQILFEGAQALLANKPVLDQIASDPFGKIPANIVDLMGQMQPIPGAIEGFAALRTAANPVGTAIYQDRPLIVARHDFYRRDVETGDFMTVSAMDIVDGGVGVVPYSGVDPRYARVLQGLTDAGAEDSALRGADVPFGAGTLLTSGPLSDWEMLSPGDALDGLPPDLSAGVAVALKAGHLALVPRGALAQTGLWWDIKPDNGSTLAMGPDGWGQSLVEYAFILVLKTLWAQIGCMARMGTKSALTQALTTGKVNLPKSMEEAEKGGKDLVKACVTEALVNSITGMASTIFVGLPAFANQSLNDKVFGTNYGSKAPSNQYASSASNPCPSGLPGTCAINTSFNPAGQRGNAQPGAGTAAGANTGGGSPATAATQPGTSPNSATTQPGSPATAATQPGTSLNGTTTQPGNPATASTQPGTAPNGTTTQPGSPATAATQPGTSPVGNPDLNADPFGKTQSGTSGSSGPAQASNGTTPEGYQKLTPDQLSPALGGAYQNAVNGINGWQQADNSYTANPTPENAAALEQAAIASGAAEQKYVRAKLQVDPTGRSWGMLPHPADDPRVTGYQGSDDPVPSTQPAPPTPPLPGGGSGGFGTVLSGLGGLKGGLDSTE